MATIDANLTKQETIETSDQGDVHEKDLTQTYLIILGVLAISTIIEFLIGSYFAWPKPVLLIVLLAIAFFKAYFVVAYFMHVKYDIYRKKILIGVFGFPLLMTLPIGLFPIFG